MLRSRGTHAYMGRVTNVPSRALDFPVFDVDNHLYESTDAFTRHLPAEYEGLIKYVEVAGRTKIAVRNVISDNMPNSTVSEISDTRSLVVSSNNVLPDCTSS